MTVFRLALANLRYPASPDDAVTRATDAIADAGRQGAQLICFPECYLPGYRGLGWAPPPPDPSFLEGAWSTLAVAARDAAVVVLLGTERPTAAGLCISTLVLDRDGTRLGFQDKVQLDPSEEGTYVPGTERQLFRAAGLTFGIAICHEGWRYPETVRWAAQRGAQVVFLPHLHQAEGDSHRPTTFGETATSFHEKALLCRAAENTVYIAAANYASDGTPTTATVVNPDGTLHSFQPYGREGVFIADVELSLATGLLASRYRPFTPAESAS